MKISGAFAAASAATFAIAARTAVAFSAAPSRPAAVAVGGVRTTTTTSATTTALSASADDKTEVREYFNNEGFSRWNKIYSDSDEVNTVQLDIRKGHDMTIQKILGWVSDDGDIAGKTVCDCGCGVGSLAIPLAQMGEFHSLSRSPTRRDGDGMGCRVLFFPSRRCCCCCRFCFAQNCHERMMRRIRSHRSPPPRLPHSLPNGDA